MTIVPLVPPLVSVPTEIPADRLAELRYTNDHVSNPRALEPPNSVREPEFNDHVQQMSPECLRDNSAASSLNNDFETTSTTRHERSCPPLNKLNVILTNARSLSPKIKSLIDYLSELEVTAAIVSESWMKDGADLDSDLLDLEKGTALKMIYKNRNSQRKTERTSVCQYNI